AGFSSFFLDYKHPSLTNSGYNSTPTMDPLDPQSSYSTPPETSTSSSSVSTTPSTTTYSSLLSATLTPAQATRTLVIKRKLFDNNQEELKAAIASITVDERIDLQELESFAGAFKAKRLKYGCTQNDIGLALGRKYGIEFSQTTISRFEALNLSFKNMCKLRPLLKEWMAEVEAALAEGISVNDFLQRPPATPPPRAMLAKTKKTGERQRKRRTFIDEKHSELLAEEYVKNNRPSPKQYNDISERLKLDKEVIRIWFSNHRQKIRKMEDERLTLEMQVGDGRE
ncbi:hypothetical protein PMAYCL1PPCAC_02642, partial [Pristionchus mayeri]